MVIDEMRGGVPPAPAAARLRRPGWRDGRLLVGLLLVLASIALGAHVVSSADRTVPVYAARGTMPAGSPVTADRLAVVRIRLSGTRAAYLDARRAVPAGRVLIRTVGPGEPVPVSAVASAAELHRRPVAVPLDGSPPAGLVTGGLVDVWASAKQTQATAGAGFAAPRRIAQGVEVYAVATGGTGLAAGRGSTVQVLLGAQELPGVLDALANEARLQLLPLPGSGPGAEP